METKWIEAKTKREKRQRKMRTEKDSDAGEDAVVRDSIPAEEIQTEIMINYSRSNICTTIIVVGLFWLTKLKRQKRRNEKSWKSILLRFLRTLKKLNTKCSENRLYFIVIVAVPNKRRINVIEPDGSGMWHLFISFFDCKFLYEKLTLSKHPSKLKIGWWCGQKEIFWK